MVPLHLAAMRLQVEDFLDPIYRENTVTSSDSFTKTYVRQHGARIIKADISIRRAAEYLFSCFIVLAQATALNGAA